MTTHRNMAAGVYNLLQKAVVPNMTLAQVEMIAELKDWVRAIAEGNLEVKDVQNAKADTNDNFPNDDGLRNSTD